MGKINTRLGELPINNHFIYFNDVDEAEKLKIEHKNRMRLLGIEMSAIHLLNEELGGSRMI